MAKIKKRFSVIFSLSFILFFILLNFAIIQQTFANNLDITNVSLEDRDPAANTLIVEFDIDWDNSFRGTHDDAGLMYDAAWITIRLDNSTTTASTLCTMTNSGLDPTGTDPGTNSQSLEVYVPSDKMGAFIRRSTDANGTVSSNNAQLMIDYDSCGFDDTDKVRAKVLGIEMVYVGVGSFSAGDKATSTGSLKQGTADDDPWAITSEDTITTTNTASNGYYYVASTYPGTGENSDGDIFDIPAAFPKGFQAFYAMRYEITEGQWIEFYNQLMTDLYRTNRDITNASHKNSDAWRHRNTLSCTSTSCSGDTADGGNRDDRSINYINWMDFSAFLDWAALRPMTELEYEKLSRGEAQSSVDGEYAWGTTSITQAITFNQTPEDGTERFTTANANCNYGIAHFLQGDAYKGTESYYDNGGTRVGIFAKSTTTRGDAGSGFYGAMDLSGNQQEMIVTIGNSAGRGFTGGHGDGVLTTTISYVGNANTVGWVGFDATTARGITRGTGMGFRGGSHQEVADRARVSDRYNAALTDVTLVSQLRNYGGRGVRTDDE